MPLTSKLSPDHLIVVVEDDDFLSDAYRVKFTQAGLNVVMAKDGKTALDLIHQKKPSLIILDLMLPVMDGYAVLQELKKDDQLKDVPVLIASNFSDQEHIKKGKDMGAVDFFVKSEISIGDLIAKCEQHCQVAPVAA